MAAVEEHNPRLHARLKRYTNLKKAMLSQDETTAL
jgi:hypothetical protein